MPDFSLSLISTVDLSTARTPSTEAHMALAWTAYPPHRFSETAWEYGGGGNSVSEPAGSYQEGVAPTKCVTDQQGNVYVTGPSGVWVISPEGEHLGVIEVPENVGNLNWGGDDWSDLYMPSSTSLYRIRMKVGGNRLGYMT